MNKQYLKTILLGILIVGCIVQTMTLWLGSVPSHNFLAQRTPIYTGVEPIQVWLLTPTGTGSSSNKSALAYAVSKTEQETATEHQRLITELQELLGAITKESPIKVSQGIDWQQLFLTPGMMYTYSMPLGIEAMRGQKKDTEMVMKLQGIDQIFVQSTIKRASTRDVYFLNTTDNVMMSVQVDAGFEDFDTIYDYVLTERRKTGAVTYQPSAVSNVSRYIKGNAFMPIASQSMPIEYPVLALMNPIPEDTQEAVKALEPYVNQFFMNPLLKETEVGEDGIITFKEERKAVVVYNPKGTLEYINLDPKMSAPDSFQKGHERVNQFVNHSAAIHEVLRDKFYLSHVKKQGDVYHYSFNLSFEGYDLQMTQEIQQQLGLESPLQIRVEGNEITTVKMSLLVMIPKKWYGTISQGRLKTEYVDPINKGLQEIQKAGYSDIVFNNSTAMYVMDKLEGDLELKRGILFGDRWYYPR